MDDMASNEEIKGISKKLKSMMQIANSINLENKISFTRQEDHNKDMQANGEWFLKAMLLEVLCFIGVLAY